MKIRVYYEDTDAGGIVYHTNYIKYCERARSELFFRKALKPFEGDSSGFVVKRIDANFIGSAKLGDIVEVKSRVLHLKRASVTLKQIVYLNDEKLFEMDILLVYIEGSKPKKIPEKFLEILKETSREFEE